jgi:drug/metabolite transporter (DMT)-like permease
LNALIGLLCAIWGFNWVSMKLANGAFPPVLFAAYRFGLGAIISLGFCWYKRISIPKGKMLGWIAVCGLLQTTYFNIAIQLSLNDLSAGLTSVLTYSMPLWLLAGIVGSAFAFVLWFRILSGANASKASISLPLVPVVGVL